MERRGGPRETPVKRGENIEGEKKRQRSGRKKNIAKGRWERKGGRTGGRGAMEAWRKKTERERGGGTAGGGAGEGRRSKANEVKESEVCVYARERGEKGGRGAQPEREGRRE